MKHMHFKTQQDCWHFLSMGGTMYQGDTKIKFSDGKLIAEEKGKRRQCPATFENPRLFHYA